MADGPLTRKILDHRRSCRFDDSSGFVNLENYYVRTEHGQDQTKYENISFASHSNMQLEIVSCYAKL